MSLATRLAAARQGCIDRWQGVADWIEDEAADDRAALQQCAHRLYGTAGSYGFEGVAAIARKLEGGAATLSAEELEVICAELCSQLRQLAQP